MKRKVEANILGAEGSVIADDIHVHGRLLGAITIMEGTKILQNDQVAKRLATAETKPLEAVVTALETIAKDEKDAYKHGRLVIAVSAMKNTDDGELTDTLTRQLFLSAPVSLITETVRRPTGEFSATLTCTDDSLIIINEKETHNE